MVNFSTISLLGVHIHSATTVEVLTTVDGWLRDKGKPRVICTTNADFVIKARRDKSFREIINHADLSIPDGMAVVYASRILRTPLSETVNGRLIVPKLCQLAADRGWSVFFLGGRPGAARSTANRLKRQYPGLKVAGSFCPLFGFRLGDEEDKKAVAHVREAKPDLLFVALGAPKQEKWIMAHMDDLKVPLSMGVGYTFDVLGGFVREPPRWMTKIGLEWLCRLAREPRRLWRRYLADGVVFVGLVLKARWRQNQ
jgi:N-acetylglucosaminyldiphosphoundecaprenol N-acetyl-beta-D-mannosaminyltransferase